MQFRQHLAMQLFQHSKRVELSRTLYQKKTLSIVVNSSSGIAYEENIRLSDSRKECEACKYAERVNICSKRQIKRKLLQKLHPSNIQSHDRRNRVLRSNFECALCNIHLCNYKRC